MCVGGSQIAIGGFQVLVGGSQIGSQTATGEFQVADESVEPLQSDVRPPLRSAPVSLHRGNPWIAPIKPLRCYVLSWWGYMSIRQARWSLIRHSIQCSGRRLLFLPSSSTSSPTSPSPSSDDPPRTQTDCDLLPLTDHAI